MPVDDHSRALRQIDACARTGHEDRLSLKQLAADCRTARLSGMLPDELRYVRGFTWFFGYMIDSIVLISE